jgi:hypothetical protein
LRFRATHAKLEPPRRLRHTGNLWYNNGMNANQKQDVAKICQELREIAREIEKCRERKLARK